MPGLIAKQKKFFFTLFLFIFLFWLVTIQVKAGRLTFMEKPVLAVSGFFERIITGAYNAVGSVGQSYAILVRTHRENVRLKEEVERLTLENSITNELLAENGRLRDLLGFKRLQQPASVAVQVIGNESSPSSRTITINKGADDGIGRDMVVITAEGVVGKVQSVLPGTAKVILLTDPGSTLAVQVQRNREEGLLEGKLAQCALKYVSYYADIQEGDLLVTSGLDGIYPKGLPVARVAAVTKQEASAFQAVMAEPVVSFSRLEEALVLKK
jgi:rod shape-determining protein MreC